MSSWDSEQYWSKSGQSFNLDDDKLPKYKFDDISKYSSRSNRHVQHQPNPVVASKTSSAGCPVSIISESDLECSQLLCSSCNKIITEEDVVKYEGNRIFTNEICWKHWIRKMVESETFQIRDLVSHAAQRYFLDCICLTCNGQLIMKVILTFKGALGEFEFGSLLYDNNVAYNHYMSFLRETRQTNEKLLRCSNMSEEPMKNLREIMNDNCNVSSATVGQFIQKLVEIRDEIKLNNTSMVTQSEMIGEYASLLELQATKYPHLINQPFVATCIESKLSQQSINDTSVTKFLKDNFKMAPEEFFWTCLKPIILQGKFADIEKAQNHKGYGCKPDILYERIVSFLYSLTKEPDDLKMKCLLKISNINDLINCANSYGLLNSFMEYCQKNRESSVLKKLQQTLQSYSK